MVFSHFYLATHVVFTLVSVLCAFPADNTRIEQQLPTGAVPRNSLSPNPNNTIPLVTDGSNAYSVVSRPKRQTSQTCPQPSPYCEGDGRDLNTASLCQYTNSDDTDILRLPTTLYPAVCSCAFPHIHRLGNFRLGCSPVSVRKFVFQNGALTPINIVVGCTTVRV